MPLRCVGSALVGDNMRYDHIYVMVVGFSMMSPNEWLAGDLQGMRVL